MIDGRTEETNYNRPSVLVNTTGIDILYCITEAEIVLPLECIGANRELKGFWGTRLP